MMPFSHYPCLKSGGSMPKGADPARDGQWEKRDAEKIPAGSAEADLGWMGSISFQQSGKARSPIYPSILLYGLAAEKDD